MSWSGCIHLSSLRNGQTSPGLRNVLWAGEECQGGTKIACVTIYDAIGRSAPLFATVIAHSCRCLLRTTRITMDGIAMQAMNDLRHRDGEASLADKQLFP